MNARAVLVRVFWRLHALKMAGYKARNYTERDRFDHTWSGPMLIWDKALCEDGQLATRT